MTHTPSDKMSMIPDFGPYFAFWSKQTEVALYLNDQMMRAALAPWQAMGMPSLRMFVSGPARLLETPSTPRPATGTATAKPAPMTDPSPAANASGAHVMDDPTPGAAAAVAAPPAAHATPARKPKAAHASEAPTPQPRPEPAPAKKAPSKPAAGSGKAAVTPSPDAARGAEPAMARPAGLDAPRGGVSDSLRAIKGMGPKIEEALNEIGVYHYDQIAAWTDANIAWADENVGGVRGRASRDDWRGQAAALARGDAS